MENQLLGQILNNVVMEKAVRDKIKLQMKDQQEEEAEKRRRQEEDDLFDEEAEEIFKRMREERMQDYSKEDQRG
jgi:hypothetical protein